MTQDAGRRARADPREGLERRHAHRGDYKQAIGKLTLLHTIGA
jgi:hypothetical protein